MNPVLVLTFNNLELTKRCVESVRGQDVETEILVIDNGSTDGTWEWLDKQDFEAIGKSSNEGVSAGWNEGLRILFSEYNLKNPTHALVLNNDVVIPPWFYSELLSYPELFVTGVAIDQMPTVKAERMPLSPNPDFSAFLIRREAWEKIGPFDERMKIYCSDCDYHIRGHRLGVGMMKANIPYYHVNSQTLKRAEPEIRNAIEGQANADREVFRSLYGCLPGTGEYEALFGGENG